MADALAGIPFALAASLAAIWTLLAGATAMVAVMVRCGARNAGELAARVRTWWWIVGAVSVALVGGPLATAILFAGVSLLALREYLAIVPARGADRGAIVLALLAVPAQYLLVLDGWYGLFTIFIPVFMTAAIAIRLAFAGETAGFLRATAVLQWGLVLTVYNLSHLAFLARLDTAPALPAGGAGLLLFLLVVVQSNDVAQYVWGRLLGRRRITPTVSPNKTWAGFLGGTATTIAVAALLAPWLTPFPFWQALVAGAGLAALGFAGDITVSAVKRDLGLKDTGAMLPGHGGLLDRLDSLVFAGPVFFHAVRTAYGA